jgi:hypothetical protein
MGRRGLVWFKFWEGWKWLGRKKMTGGVFMSSRYYSRCFIALTLLLGVREVDWPRCLGVCGSLEWYLNKPRIMSISCCCMRCAHILRQTLTDILIIQCMTKIVKYVLKTFSNNKKWIKFSFYIWINSWNTCTSIHSLEWREYGRR